ncbi:cation diffusion facilitator family transporter [Gulbenkiania indica]|uniref:Cation diffusion facilitator family transporter n=1 Tax=Gulbenkiania indica TaxID=375574 RepID=A0A0K6GUI5_9NEIS|nr:cation diffusion facilitator family transporter [Gulbenkiania indica]CUA82455.1 cation diffusion facilitator family transporter [Gulbenkiania indica]
MSETRKGTLTAIFYALGANGGIALSKFLAALYTGSGAMLAEAIHSTADCANQLLLLVGLRQARKPANADHPLGHGRVVYFWSMMVAQLLFGMGAVFSVVEGVKRLNAPSEISNPYVALVVLAVAVGLEGFSLRGALRQIRKAAPGKPFLRWFRETRQSELMVVAGEDIAALIGLSLALVAVCLTLVTGNPVYDAWGSIAVGVVLGVVSLAVLVEVKSLIVGESVNPELRRAISEFVAAQPEVRDVISIITLAWGDRIVIAIQAEMTEAVSASRLVDDINAVEARIQEKWPFAAWVFFEPDHRRPQRDKA